LESKRVYTIFHLKNKTELICCRNIKNICEELNSLFFVRIHRSVAINLAEVVQFFPGRSCKLIMSDDSRLGVSVRKTGAFKKCLRRWKEMMEELSKEERASPFKKRKRKTKPTKNEKKKRG
jgi:DNA-binding LytR/AlgR family response regulator